MTARASTTATPSPRAHPHLWAALLLGLVVFAYLWPVLVGGKILAPNAVLYTYVPWSGYAPPGLGDYFNPLLDDVPMAVYPWRFVTRMLLHEGTFPAWNPYVLSGIPLYQNPATGLFSVLDLPLWILPLNYALGLSAALKLFVGGFGAYLLARQLRLGFLPGLLAGVAFAFTAVNIVWLAHDTLTAVAVLAPWLLWLVERLFERRRAGDAIALAGATAIALGGGHPGMQVHLLVVVAAYALVRAACTRGPRTRPLLLAIGGLAAGSLLMAFMLIPEARSAHDTVGAMARRTSTLPGQHLPFASLKTVVFPDWWGQPGGVEAPGDASNGAALAANYCERTFYAGAVALLLACVGLLAPGRRRRQLPFVVVGVLGLAVALRAPGLQWLVTHLPVLRDLEPQRLHFTFALAVPQLAAFGLQALLDTLRPARGWLAVPLVALLGGAFALATAQPQAGDVDHLVMHFLKRTDYASQAVLAMTSVVWFMLFALAVGVGLLLARARPGWRVWIAAALVLLAAADALHFVGRFQPMGPPSTAMPPATPAIAYLRARRNTGRVVGLEEALPNDWALVYGLRDVRGYDTPQPTRRLLALWRVASPQQSAWTPFEVANVTTPALHVLGVLGARYMLAPPEFRLARGAPRTLAVAYAGPDATILENRAVTPRVLVPAALRLTADQSATHAAIAESRFDPRTTVVAERDQPGAAALARAPLARGEATIVEERNARVTLRTGLDRPGLVMLDDQLTEGWIARVDGRPVPTLYVDGAMRGAIVPAGRHELVWSYRVPGLRAGVALSLVTLLLLVAAALWLRFGASLDRARVPRPARLRVPAT
jgi:hypothetical protein